MPLRRDHLVHDPNGPLLVAGGSGVVGRQLVSLLSAAYAERDVVVLARDEARAAAAVALHPRARFTRLDRAAEEPIALAGAALVTLVNDPDDRLLIGAVRGGLPVVDIARFTSRLLASLAHLATVPLRAPVVFSSGWMGGLAPRLAAALAARLPRPIDRIDVAVRYALADASGDDSVEYMDRLALPFETQEDGARRVVTPLSDGRRVSVGGASTRVYRIDTPEQLTLPIVLGARTVGTRIGFDQGWATFGLVTLQRLGVFCALSSDRFAGVRRALLHAKGEGGEARFRVDVVAGGASASATAIDPAGQAHLTAVGALASLRQALSASTPAGVCFPEQDAENARWLEATSLARLGVRRVDEAGRGALAA